MKAPFILNVKPSLIKKMYQQEHQASQKMKFWTKKQKSSNILVNLKLVYPNPL